MALPDLMLGENTLPWVETIPHLGITISNDIRGILDKDMEIKKAQYITKNIELNQELFFATYNTKIYINKVYNLSFFGCILWNLFGQGMVKIESCYNRSMKIMMNLPFHPICRQ